MHLYFRFAIGAHGAFDAKVTCSIRAWHISSRACLTCRNALKLLILKCRKIAIFLLRYIAHRIHFFQSDHVARNFTALVGTDGMCTHLFPVDRICDAVRLTLDVDCSVVTADRTLVA